MATQVGNVRPLRTEHSLVAVRIRGDSMPNRDSVVKAYRGVGPIRLIRVSPLASILARVQVRRDTTDIRDGASGKQKEAR